MPKVSVNNEWIDLEQSSLREAMRTLNYLDTKCAVAVNGEFVPRASYDKITLKNGDTVDVVAPVGGG